MTNRTANQSAAALEVLLFGALKDAVHSASVAVAVPVGASTLSLDELRAALAEQYPALERYLPHVRVAVNCEYCNGQERIQIGDEVALIPPVAGG
jgi:molybdopterin converting factor subunit 1